METSNFKNMVVLKDLPSNIVEEAIVILKSNKNAKKLEKIDKVEKKNMKRQKENSNIKEGQYILKEAEMLVSNYIAKIENKNKIVKSKETTKKYNKLKNYAFISSIIIFIETLIILVK